MVVGVVQLVVICCGSENDRRIRVPVVKLYWTMNNPSSTSDDEALLRPNNAVKGAAALDPLISYDEHARQNGHHGNDRSSDTSGVDGSSMDVVMNPPADLPRNSISADNDLKNGDNDEDNSDAASSDAISVDDNDEVDPYYNRDDDRTMTLTERRTFNIQRNHELLSSLGMMNNCNLNNVNGNGKRHRKDRSSDSHSVDDGTTHGPSRGMIIPSCWAAVRQQQQQQQLNLLEPTPNDIFPWTLSTTSSALSQLQQRYPHRSKQIRKLYSLISVPLQSNTTTPLFVAPPIIVTGPAGCGKTSIVRDVVAHLCHPPVGPASSSTSSSSSIPPPQPPPLVLQAYVDCTTLDHTNIEELMAIVYTQWFEQVPKRNTAPHHRQPTKSKSRQRVPSTSTTDDNHTVEVPKRVSRMRQAKTATRSIALMMEAHDQHQHLSGKGKSSKDMEHNLGGAQSSVLTAIWTFGRSIQRFLDRIRRDHANSIAASIPLVLMVDHAEVLLCMGTTYSKSSNADRINFFAQLMLLPRTLGLNLTMIFISKNILLEHAGM